MNDALQDDGTLINLITERNAAALGELYDRYHRLVFSIAYRIIGDRGIAAEITLDVFTHVWQRADSYRPERAKVSTWISAISRNRAIDLLRQHNIRPESNSISWELVPSPPASAAHDLEDQVERALQREQVRAALATLPDEQRQVLSLAYFKGYTHQQIADELQQPLGTVKTRIRLAMQKLRQTLQAEDPAGKEPTTGMTPTGEMNKSDDPSATYYNKKD